MPVVEQHPIVVKTRQHLNQTEAVTSATALILRDVATRGGHLLLLGCCGSGDDPIHMIVDLFAATVEVESAAIALLNAITIQARSRG